MDLKKLMGEKWKEDLTVDEIVEFLAGLELNEGAEKPAENVVSKELFDKVSSQLAALKKEANQAKQAKASVEEQTAERINELQKSIVRLKAEKEFTPLGVDPTGLLDSLLNDGDPDGVVAAMTKLLSTVKEEAVNSAKESLLKSSPKPPGSPPEYTGETLANMTITDRMKFATEHPEQYQQLLGGA